MLESLEFIKVFDNPNSLPAHPKKSRKNPGISKFKLKLAKSWVKSEFFNPIQNPISARSTLLEDAYLIVLL
jgi:hypothetical protein